jgi:hypothetical protein
MSENKKVEKITGVAGVSSGMPLAGEAASACKPALQ